jgi:hypothetical protein
MLRQLHSQPAQPGHGHPVVVYLLPVALLFHGASFTHDRVEDVPLTLHHTKGQDARRSYVDQAQPRPGSIPCRNIIHLHKNQAVPNIYDVEMEGFERLKAYDRVECHVVLYPYSRKVSSENIAFYPFEEYVKDVLSQRRSAYAEIQGQFNEIFGLLLGALIAIIFVAFKPQELFSVESVVSVFGAYVIGKELWDDLDRALVRLSRNWRLSYQDSYYRYQLEKHTTLATYSSLAKRRRYGRASLLPEKVDFIKQSNSQTVRMCFNMKDLASFAEPSAHILSIHVDPAVLQDLETEGFMFGVKLSLNRRFLGVQKCFELFQSLDQDSVGCLDQEESWAEGAVFYRRTLTCGRFKYYAHKGLMREESILGEILAASPSFG